MRYDLTSLEIFVAVAETANLTRAAEQQHLAVSAISKRITELEELAGSALLQRHPRGVSLTPAGPASVSPPSDTPVIVQIGAFSSERIADQEWSKAAAVAPGAMVGKGKRVVPVSKDGAMLYRTSITGFDSREQAEALCARLKSAGGTCFVR